MKSLHHIGKYQITYYQIQCKILFENSFVKLVSEALLPDAYAAVTTRVRDLQEDSFVGTKTCDSILTDLQLGCFQKYKNITDIKTMTKKWIIKYSTEGQPFLISVYNRQNWSETWIGIVNDMIVESQ